jgi:hypothetical protein
MDSRRLASLMPARIPRWSWALAAAAAATLPLVPGLSGSRIFYIRDLSLYFWGRYLWLRHAWLEGRWPLWDPYVGGGQAAVADALHQMFLPPAVLLRLVGGEVLGFNLWIAAPFPLAALGAWLFLARRFSAAAATLGAIAFALCGPIYSTGNFPNMSWTVAAIPWTLLAADRLAGAPGARRLAALAVVVAMQALAGEPVTLLATLLLVSAYAFVVGAPGPALRLPERATRCAWVAGGLALGLALAAVQLVPMAQAAAESERAQLLRNAMFWSLHPLMLVETIAPRLFGDYYVSQSLAAIPWVPVLNSGREPFFFSLYFGVPLLAVALGGVIAGQRRWTTFWLSAAALALVGAFGSYTPVYPFLRDHLPLLSSFRFPAKYIVVVAMAVAACAAAGWDAVVSGAPSASNDAAKRGRIGALSLAIGVGIVALGAAGACVYFATPTVFRLFAIARGLGSGDPVGAAEFMLKSLPGQAATLLFVSLVTAVLLGVAGDPKRAAAPALRTALFLVIVADLAVRAWPVNPVFDAAHLSEPGWLARTTMDRDARFYVGGKRDGTLDASDVHASRGYLNPPGLIGSASRAALSGQTAFYPSAWHGREMLSYDLAVLWPSLFDMATREFFERSTTAGRDRFLDRTGVRFRVLPARLAAGHEPLVSVPYYLESHLYDWGPGVAPRAKVVPRASVVEEPERQIHALFGPAWDEECVLVTRVPAPAGAAGAGVAPSARIADDLENRVVVEAGAGAEGGYLVLLDSFATGWRARVDGEPADIVRANGLFRAVRLRPGRHAVVFEYRPSGVVWGGLASAASLLSIGALLANSRARGLLEAGRNIGALRDRGIGGWEIGH